jgi:mono/diheme cytochrome c family protein
MPNHVSGVYQTAAAYLLAATLSYTHDIRPILRHHCVSCHGQDNVSSGGLDLRTYRTLRLGGNIGDDVVAGNSDASVLVQLIEGRRGAEHRMPLHAQPLSSEQILRIRRWIAEGARP